MAIGTGIVSLLDLDINTIIGYNEMNPSEYYYTVSLNTTEFDIPISLLESVEILRDYGTNIGDQLTVTFRVGMGDFIKDIYPNRDNLEMTVTMNVGTESYTEKYKFVTTNNNSNVYGTRLTSQGRDELNAQEQTIVEGQCVSRLVEQLRTTYVDGVYANHDVMSVIRSRLKQHIVSVKIGGVIQEVNIDIYTPDNDRVYDHIQVPTGTKLLDLPTLLHEGDYGVYNGNIGTYLQNYGIGPTRKNTIFVYPLYNISRYDTEDRKAIFYSSPSHKYQYVENTYMVDGKIIKIISNGNIKSMDAGENEYIDIGNSIVSSDPNSVMERNVIVKDKDSVSIKELNMSGESNSKKRDNVNKQAYIKHDDNLYRHRSEVMATTMSLHQITWNFCNPEYLYPGMPVAYIYESSELGTVTLKGVLHSIYFRYDNATKSTTALVNVFVEKPFIAEAKIRNA